MKYGLLFVLLLSFFCSPAQDVSGIWMGTINVGEGKSRVVVVIQKDSAAYRSFTEMPEFITIGRKVPFDAVEIDSNRVHLNLIHRIFIDGSIIDDSTIEARFRSHQPEFDEQFLLKKTNQYPNLNRPQTPQPPYNYESIDINYYDSITRLNYGGTLTVPKNLSSEIKYPAIVLLSGSEPDDRDNTFGAHKLFKVLADYLTNQGFAVLRTDDRGVGDTEGDFKNAAFNDLVEDAAAAVRFLKTRPEVDTTKIGLLGHSEGGLVAPALAAGDKTIRFLVLMAAPAIRYKEIIVQQLKNNKICGVNAATTDSTFLNNLAEGIMTSTAGYQSLSDYEPGATLAKLKIPVLALNGDKDLQVAAQQNIPVIESSLKKARNKNFKTLILKGLNHTFQTCIRCTYNEAPFLEQTISPEALNIIGEWLNKSVNKKK